MAKVTNSLPRSDDFPRVKLERKEDEDHDEGPLAMDSSSDGTPSRAAPSSSAKRTADAKRPDGRLDAQIRAPETEQSLLSRADGSIRYSQGKTSVLVSVNGPLAVRLKDEKIDRAVVEVLFKSASGQATHFDVDKGELIRQALEAIIITSLHPCTKITVVVQVVRDDGSLLATALNAACLALLDAGIQCSSMLSASSIALWEGDRDRLLLDPDHEEEKVSESLVTLAFSTRARTAAESDTASDTAGGGGNLLLSETRGMPGEGPYLACLELGQRAASTVEAFFRLALAKKLGV